VDKACEQNTCDVEDHEKEGHVYEKLMRFLPIPLPRFEGVGLALLLFLPVFLESALSHGSDGWRDKARQWAYVDAGTAAVQAVAETPCSGVALRMLRITFGAGATIGVRARARAMVHPQESPQSIR
jgi:hypothetical protein